MSGATCPRCNADRPDAAVFCPACGFNFAGESFSQRYGVQPAQVPAASPKGTGGARLVLVVAGIAVAGVAIAFVLLLNQPSVTTTLPGAVATDRPATLEPATDPPEEFTAPPEEIAAKIGQAIQIINTDTGADYGTVTVLAGKRYAKIGDYLVADKGKVWIGAKVRYTAVAPFDYNMFDWVAHDSAGNQYQLGGYALSPELIAGVVAKGRKVEGWIAFELATGTKALWVDYAPGGGAVIFSVKVWPAK